MNGGLVTAKSLCVHEKGFRRLGRNLLTKFIAHVNSSPTVVGIRGYFRIYRHSIF